MLQETSQMVLWLYEGKDGNPETCPMENRVFSFIALCFAGFVPTSICLSGLMITDKAKHPTVR